MRVTKDVLADHLSMTEVSVHSGDQTPGYWYRQYMGMQKAELVRRVVKRADYYTNPTNQPFSVPQRHIDQIVELAMEVMT